MRTHFLLLCVILSLTSFACGPAAPLLDFTVTDTQLHQAAVQHSVCALDHVVVKHYGDVVYEGEMDLNNEVQRIVLGSRLKFPHDGSIFHNKERRLPVAPQGFYHEYVHPTPGLTGPGPQRLIRPKVGPFVYTPDHYATFLALDAACGLRLWQLTQGDTDPPHEQHGKTDGRELLRD
jgi:guanyl-specific ribonuclease Sa